ASAVAAGMKLRGEGSVHGDTNDVAAQCDLIVVATPFDSAIATVKTLRPALAGKIVISMVNALAREAREMVPLYPSRGSMAAQIAHALPDSLIVGAFHHLPASMMEDLDSGLDADVVIFSDDDGARVRVAEIVDAMPGLHAVIAGSMSLASPIEAFTAVCISVNIRHKAHSYVKLAGLQH
ncbi:MAG: NAD(P)-binding domain-containing protein, partial [Acidimicrobiales bacterium]